MLSTFIWNIGRVENMSESVEATTNRQEATATIWKLTSISKELLIVFRSVLLRRTTSSDSPAGSTTSSGTCPPSRRRTERRSPPRPWPPAAAASAPCSRCAGSTAPGGGRSGPSSRAPRKSPERRPEIQKGRHSQHILRTRHI